MLRIFDFIFCYFLLTSLDVPASNWVAFLHRFTPFAHSAIMKVGQHFSMPQSTPPEFGINSWLEDELYQQYLHDRKTVDDTWKQVFESNGGTPAPTNGTPVVTTPGVTAPVTVTSAPAPAEKPSSGDQLLPLRGAAARIAENMNASLR